MDRILSRRVFGGSADGFKMTLEMGTSPYVSVELEWTSDESEATVVERLVQRKTAHSMANLEERLVLQLEKREGPDAAEHPVAIAIKVASNVPQLRAIQVTRTTTSGAVSDSLMAALLKHCEVEGVYKLKGSEGFGNWWATIDPQHWKSVRSLNLSYCGLAVLPAAIGGLGATLKVLRLSHNKLATLPPEIGQLEGLEVLAADHNLLTTVPVELRQLSALRELNLEGNRIATPVLDLRMMHSTLQSLQLFGNPLEYLPELTPCTQLRSLSLANVRIMADATYTRWEIEVGALPYMARGHKLTPLFRLTFRRSSLQHPLLAGALGRIAEDRGNCELIAKEEVAVQQLVLMALSENPVVVKQACKTIGHLASISTATVNKLISHDVLSAAMSLITSPTQESQLCGLNMLSSLATSSDAVGGQLISPQTLARLHHLICTGDPSVRQAALLCLSNLCFSPENKRAVHQAEGLLATVVELAQSRHNHQHPHPHHQHSASRAHTAVPAGPGSTADEQEGAGRDAGAAAATVGAVGLADGGGRSGSSSLGFVSDMTRLSALRVLAVMGENEQVRMALGLPGIKGRGVRVLALDGGGMKALTMVQMLRALQARTSHPLHSLFDLVVGTSTGAIVAVSLALLRFDLDAVEAIYTGLGQKVFNQAALKAGEDMPPASWRESLWRMYKSGSQTVRVAVYGAKHDPSNFETLLQEMGDITKLGCVSNQMIDAIALGSVPKVAVVATLTSVMPAVPYVFRTYELPPGSEAEAARIAAYTGSSRFTVWQAVRASSAAPYYFDEFGIGEDRWQDGATMANNPTLVALQQARLLWPELPVDVVVSLGCGLTPSAKRGKSVHSYVDSGIVFLESACSTERVHEALATTLPLVPGIKYFRFQPVDPRCEMELDEINPEAWARLLAAAEDYCVTHAARFDEAAATLEAGRSLADTVPATGLESGGEEGEAAGQDGGVPAGGEAGGAAPPSGPLSPRGSLRLGPRCGLLVVEAPRSSLPHDESSEERVARVLGSLPHILRRANLHDTATSASHRSSRLATHGAAAAGGAGAGVTPAAAAAHIPLPPLPALSNHELAVEHALLAPAPAHSTLSIRVQAPWAADRAAAAQAQDQQAPGEEEGVVSPSIRVSRTTRRSRMSHTDGSASHQQDALPQSGQQLHYGSTGGADIQGQAVDNRLATEPTVNLGHTQDTLVGPGPPEPSHASAIQGQGRPEASTSGPPASSPTPSGSIFDYFMRWGTNAAASPGTTSPSATRPGSVAGNADASARPASSSSSGGDNPGPAPPVMSPRGQLLMSPPPSQPAIASSPTMSAPQPTPPSSTPRTRSQASAGGGVPIPGVVARTLTSGSGHGEGGVTSPKSITGSAPTGSSQPSAYKWAFRSRASADAGQAAGAGAVPGQGQSSGDIGPSVAPSGTSDEGLASPLGSTPPASFGVTSPRQLRVTTFSQGSSGGGGRVGVLSPTMAAAAETSEVLRTPSSLTSPTVALSPTTSTVGNRCADLGFAPPTKPSVNAAPVDDVTPLDSAPAASGSPQILGAPVAAAAAAAAAGVSSALSSSRHSTQGGTDDGEAVGSAAHTSQQEQPGAQPEQYAHNQQQEVTEQHSHPGLTAQALVSGLLEDLGERVGVVHLGLSHTSAGGHLVVAWDHTILTLLEPGPSCTELVQELFGAEAAATGHTLSDLTGGARTFAAQDSVYTCLARNEVITPAGQMVRSLLLQKTSPRLTLGPEDVAATSPLWSGLLVTAAGPLPRPILEALLRSGVRAVVCPESEVAAEHAHALPQLFSQLLGSLTSGEPLLSALHQAESLHPQLEGCLVCYSL